MRDEVPEVLATKVIQTTLDSLPETVRQAAEACVIEAVFMQDCLAAGEMLEEDLLGLFEGCSLADGEAATPQDLPRIRLFLDNLWDYVDAEPDLFKEEVRVTLLHELGHFLGYDEADVEARGLA